MEHYSALKRRKILTQAIMSVSPENFMLSELNQTQKEKNKLKKQKQKKLSDLSNPSM